MRLTIFIALLLFLAFPSAAQPSLAGSCQNGGTYPNCVGGEIVFTGTNYPAIVHVRVTNSSQEVIDDGDYTTTGGVLTFTENLSFADTYTITVNHQVVLQVTTG